MSAQLYRDTDIKTQSRSRGNKNFMRQLPPYMPLIAGSLVVSGVVIASGGSILQSGIAGVTTGATGFATSALVTQSQVKRLTEQGRDRLELAVENQASLLSSGNQSERLPSLHELLQQNIAALSHHKDGLYESGENVPQNTLTLNEINSSLEVIKATLERVESTISLKNGYTRSPQLEGGSGVFKSVIEQDREQSTLGNGTKVLIDFLESRDIIIRAFSTEDPADDVINSLAKFLGENYDSLRELLARIKRHMQTGSQFSLSLKTYIPKDINNICKFCTRLYDIAFLEKYDYSKAPQYLIKAKPTTLSTAQNFFSGKWLERFVFLAVQRCISLISTELERDIVFSCLLNPQIVLPNGDDFELDLICYIDGSFFWIEAKSASYQQHINKYSKISKLLNLDFKHAIMVLPDISEDRCVELTSIFSMTVCPLSRLEGVLAEAIRKDQLV